VKQGTRTIDIHAPGDLLQMDTKRFARFSRPGHAVTGDRNTTGAEKRQRVGYEIAHSIIDDHSRLAYTELHRDEKAATVVAFAPCASSAHSDPTRARRPSSRTGSRARR
jgi:hypothetical protein